MRWKVLLGLFVFAASVAGLIGIAASPAHAGGGSSVTITIGSQHHSNWRGGGYRESWRHHSRPHRHLGRKTRRVFHPPYWPRPWPAPPRVVYVEPPREIATTPSPALTPKPYCREFQKQIIIDGRTEQAYGEACLQPDGIWKIQP